MKFFPNDYVVRLLLIFEFIVVVFGCVLLYLVAPRQVLLLSLAFAAGGSVLTYSALRYRQIKRMHGYLDEVMNGLDFLANDEDAKLVILKHNPHLATYYEKLDAIKIGYRKKEDDRQRVLNLVNSVAANMEIEGLLEDLLPKLLDVTHSNCGVFYLANHSTNKLEIKKSVGFSKNIYSEFDLSLGEGFIGISALTQEIKISSDIPDDTPYIIRTFLGKVKPKSIMTMPITNQNQLVGVFAFASIYDYSQDQLDVINLTKYYVGAAVDNSVTYEKTKRLTNELKFQNRLIQNLNDNLEAKVQDRTIFLNDIMDSISDYAIYAIDREGIVLVWNKGAEILFGYSAKETIGQHIETTYPPMKWQRVM